MSGSDMATDEDALYCPHCNYDVRFTENRCPECGHAFDRQALRVSRIPWVHRREIGRVRAWLRTAWLVVFSASVFSREVSRPVSWRDALRFRRVSLALAALVAGVAGAALFSTIDPEFYSVRFSYEVYDAPGPHLDPHPFLFPLYVLPSIPIVAIVITASIFLGGGAANWWLRAWFWIRGGKVRQRASALCCYLAVWWVAAVLMVIGEGVGFALGKHVTLHMSIMSAGMWFVAVAAPLALVLLWLASILRLLHGMLRAGLMDICVAAIAIPLGGVTLFAAVSALVMYLVGLLALMGRSLL